VALGDPGWRAAAKKSSNLSINGGTLNKIIHFRWGFSMNHPAIVVPDIYGNYMKLPCIVF
jgi:hypothetical protein